MVVLVMFIGLPAYAATTFVGPGTDFNDTANWDTGLPGLPVGDGDAVVNASATVTASIDNDVTGCTKRLRRGLLWGMTACF
jgi:hypothetical protein